MNATPNLPYAHNIYEPPVSDYARRADHSGKYVVVLESIDCEWTYADWETGKTLTCESQFPAAVHRLVRGVPHIAAGTALCSGHSPYDLRSMIELHTEALEIHAELFPPVPDAPRYIAYVGTGLPGDMSPGMMPVATVADAREYLRGYATRSGLSSVHLSLYVCLGDADMWQTARDFSDVGIPFDYADYTMTISEHGGVLVERG
jgi:hypothetical protein